MSRSTEEGPADAAFGAMLIWCTVMGKQVDSVLTRFVENKINR